jgi:hypothetical protein
MTLLPTLFVLVWTWVSKSLPKCHPAGGRGAVVPATCLTMPAENSATSRQPLQTVTIGSRDSQSIVRCF